MKLNELHWKTASNKQKAGFFASYIGLVPDFKSFSIGKTMSYSIRIDEQKLLSMDIKDSCDYLKVIIISAREQLLASIDDSLFKIAQVEALEEIES